MSFAGLVILIFIILSYPLSLLQAQQIEHVSSIHLGSRYEKAVERDGYWYLAGQWGLECWRFEGPGQFVKLSEVATPGIAQWVALEGNYAYVADGWEGLTIVDISDPYNLHFVSNFMPSFAIFPEQPGKFEYVTVKDGFVYLTGRYGIAVIDARNPLSPTQIDRIFYVDTIYAQVITDDGNFVGAPTIYDHYLLAPWWTLPSEELIQGIYQYDISDPFQIELFKIYAITAYIPNLLTARDSTLFGAGLFGVGAYVFTEGDTLIPKDSITDIVFYSGRPEDLCLSGNQLFLVGTGGATNGGVDNFNVGDLDSIYRIETFQYPVHFNNVTMVDSVGIAGYFHWDILLMRLRPDGGLDSTGYVATEANIRNIAVHSDYLYMTNGSQDIYVYDIADRRNPAYLNSLRIERPIGLSVFEDYLFSGTLFGGLFYAYDLNSPDSPVLIDSGAAPKPSGFYLWNDLLFVGHNDGVDIYDFSGDSLRFVSSSTAGGGHKLLVRDSVLFSPGGSALIHADTTISLISRIGSSMTSFDVEGDYYYASRGDFGLHIFNIQDLTSPAFVTFWDAYWEGPGDGNDIEVIDRTALLLDGDWGITIIDVSDPSNPQFISRMATPSIALTVVYDDQYFYVADAWGVEIFRHDISTDTGEIEPPLPRRFALHQNYPNPFNGGTVIEYDIPHSSLVDLSIYNILGQKVKSLLAGPTRAGTGVVTWDGTSTSGKEVTSGVYFYELSANGVKESRKMILLR